MTFHDHKAPRPEHPETVVPAMTFSVIIPCYNYGHLLREAVNSALTQSVDIRVLIIDDASTDQTEEIGTSLAQSHARVDYYRHPTNRGHIRTYNEGIEWADADAFVLLSADDMLMPHALGRAAKALRHPSSPAMAFGWGLSFDSSVDAGNVLSGSIRISRTDHSPLALRATADSTGPLTAGELERGCPDDPAMLDAASVFRLVKMTNVIPASGTVTLTDAQKEIGGYQETLPHSGDYAMWLRFAAHAPVASIPRFQVAIRRHPSNMSRQYDLPADIGQRVDALAYIDRECAHLLPAGLLEEMRLALARQSLQATTEFLDESDGAPFRYLLETARSLDPTRRLRREWLTHSLKARLGKRRWLALRRMIVTSEVQ